LIRSQDKRSPPDQKKKREKSHGGSTSIKPERQASGSGIPWRNSMKSLKRGEPGTKNYTGGEHSRKNERKENGSEEGTWRRGRPKNKKAAW